MFHHSDEKDENLEFSAGEELLIRKDDEVIPNVPPVITKLERQLIRSSAPNPEEAGLKIELIPTIKVEGPPHKQHGTQPIKQVHPSTQKG